MFLITFIHDENKLYVGQKKYRATCAVRNEWNGEREPDQIVKTYPLNQDLPRVPYYPRKFPTGLWKIKGTINTTDPEYAPVKITTSAVRTVLTWDTVAGQYKEILGHQDDAFYHLHYCRDSSTTLGCIRLNSEYDALEIAEVLKKELAKGPDVWIEVLASRDCIR